MPDAVYTPTRQLAGSSGGLWFLTHFSQNANAQVVQLACVGNAASYDSAGVAGGEIVSLFGQGLGPAMGTQPQVDQQSGFPKQLAGVQVTFNGTPGPLLYVQEAQINAIAPWSLPSGQPVQVCVVYNGAPTNCLTRTVLDGHPGVFMAGDGYAVVVNQDGTLNSASNPAKIGAYATIFATGLGAITPPQPDGSIIELPLPENVLPAEIYWFEDTFFIGSLAMPITLQYAGPAPFQVAGVSQINFVVQSTADTPFGGNTPLYLQVGPPSIGALVYPGASNGFLVHVAPQQ